MSYKQSMLVPSNTIINQTIKLDAQITHYQCDNGEKQGRTGLVRNWEIHQWAPSPCGPHAAKNKQMKTKEKFEFEPQKCEIWPPKISLKPVNKY